MSEQYKVVNPTSLFTGRIGRKVSFENNKELMLVFDGPRGDVFAVFHPGEVVEFGKVAMKSELEDRKIASIMTRQILGG